MGQSFRSIRTGVRTHNYTILIKYPNTGAPTPDDINIMVMSWRNPRATKIPIDEDFMSISDNPMSGASIAQISRWLRICIYSHAACWTRREMTTRVEARPPTRLIDLHDQHTNMWNIIVTASPSRNYIYVALSHRWTSAVPKLTRKNFSLFEAGQPDNVLPLDYQHVISLCRTLSIRYVWVDSLCIIQDSPEDFQHEAATMADVYSGALLTISICWPSQSGCMPIRDPSSFMPKVLSPKNRGFQEAVALLVNESDFGRDVLYSPVNSRGWVLQERVLSPRVLYLTKEQFYWECNNVIACEVHPNGIPILNSKEYHRRINVTHHAPGESKIDTWSRVISVYTRSSLTFHKDKFVALSGVARQMASLDGDEYIAGLWKSSLLLDLLWSPISSNMAKQRDCYAPSWSWASMLGEVDTHCTLLVSDYEVREFTTFSIHGTKPLALVQNTFVLPRGPDRFGDITDARIDVKCLVIPMTIDKCSDKISFQRLPTENNPNWRSRK
ncbi:heterokaryon incompatibility protein-domain-containing protein [Hypoxylon sp. FL1150]|nr:heterokaryon incompatibility protein-domain-containing protein [Hypoxylon sp. FL1150]